MDISDRKTIRYFSRYLAHTEKQKFFRKNVTFKLPTLRALFLVTNIILLIIGFILPKIGLTLSVTISEAFYLHSPIASFLFDVYQLGKMVVVGSIITLPILFLSWFYRSYINCYPLGMTTNEDPVIATCMLALPGSNLITTFLRLRELLSKFSSKLHTQVFSLSWTFLLVYLLFALFIRKGESIALQSLERVSVYAGFQALKTFPIFDLNYLSLVTDILLLIFCCILAITIGLITLNQRSRKKAMHSANQLPDDVTELDSNSVISRYFLFFISISVGFIIVLAIAGPVIYHWHLINRISLLSDYQYYLDHISLLRPFQFRSLAGEAIFVFIFLAILTITVTALKKQKS